MLSFTLSLDDLVISSFVTGPGANTLPMLIYSKVKLGVSPDINALASVIIGIVGSCVVFAGWLMRRTEQRRELETRMAERANESHTDGTPSVIVAPQDQTRALRSPS